MKRMMKRMKPWRMWMLAALPLFTFTACEKEGQPDADTLPQPDAFMAVAEADNGADTRATLNPDNLRQFNWLPEAENGGTGETFTVFKEGETSGTPYTFTMVEETLSDDRTTARFQAETGFEAADGTLLLATLPAGAWTAESGYYSYTLPAEAPLQKGNATTGHIGGYMPMYAVGEAQNRQVNFRFHHLFTLLKFEIKNLNSTTASFTGLAMETVETPVKAFGHRVTLAGGISGDMTAAYPVDDAAASVSLTLEDCQVETDGVLTAYIPTLCGEAFGGKCPLKFTLTADGRTCEVSLSDYSALKLDEEGKWAPGKIYTFRLLLDDELHLENVTVSGWADGEIISGGTAE